MVGVVLDIVFAAIVIIVGLTFYLEGGIIKSRLRRSRLLSSLQAPLLVAEEAVTVRAATSNTQGRRAVGYLF